MKVLVRIAIISLVLASLLAACSLGAQPPTSIDPNAINTAIAGTQQSQALAQATVNANVLTAMPATPTPGPTVEYVTLTEEELAALIDQAVNEAIAATENTSTAVTSTTSDDAVTTEDVAYVYDYYYYADYYVQYAEDLMAEYYVLYSDLATQMIGELDSIQTELNSLNQTLSSIDSSLQQINSTLQQGAEATQEAIAQLETAAQTAQTSAQALQSQAQDMMSVLQADQQSRVDAVAQLQPNSIPANQIEALQSAFQFIDAANGAMKDNKLSRDELMNLAQLGRNAQSGFQMFGGAGGPNGLDLSQFSGKFDEITNQFARGQIPQARGGVGNFESSLGNRPSGGLNLPGGNGLPGGGPSLPGADGNGPGIGPRP